MEEKDLEILHKYMLRRIAEKNIVFSGMSYKFRETSKSMRTNIFRNFARGDMSYFSPTAGNINLDYINEAIKKKSNKKRAKARERERAITRVKAKAKAKK